MNFSKKVFNLVNKIPYGKIVTYGYIATVIGSPRASRQVGWALATLPPYSEVPWWRVINAQGYLSIKNDNFSKDHQKELLKKEGIVVSSKYIVDLQKYHWRPI